MKVVLTLSLVIAVIVTAGIGCLMIFEIISFDLGMDYIFKAIAVIILLGISSVIIALVTGNKNTPGE